MGGAEKLRVAAKLFGLLQTIVVLAVFALTLSGGSASAVLLTTGNSITTNDGTTFTLTACNYTVYSGTGTNPCGVSSFTLGSNGESIVISGPGGVLASVSGGFVDTFLQFTVTSPVYGVTSFGTSVTGCGGNSTVSGCSATLSSDTATTQIYANTNSSFTGTSLGTSSVQFTSSNPTASTISNTSDFTPAVSTFYVKMDLSTQATTGYASFDSVTLSVPEPASWAVFGFGLTGLGVLRRRRRRLSRLTMLPGARAGE
jgi:hypothetical protein